jgi:hypothetical protein
MKYANDNIILPFKGRRIDKKKPIRIYRNLNKKGIWYSVVQGGKTVAHTSAICLKDCTFHVSETIRKRVVKNKKKEFHAYVEGHVTASVMGTTAKRNDLPVKVEYNPYKMKHFHGKTATDPFPLKGAMAVICSEVGVRASYTYPY